MKIKWNDAKKSNPRTSDSITCLVCKKYEHLGQTKYTYSVAVYHQTALHGTGIKAKSWESQNEVVAWVYLKDIDLPKFLEASPQDLEID